MASDGLMYRVMHQSLSSHVQLLPDMSNYTFQRPLMFFLQKYHGHIMSILLEIIYKRLYQWA